ncbi:hypothetical protein PoB_004061300 [Plakobranchus ocellatus]|uniref:Uncharacterized protein n=1 Tax=Plakobranchus ocellatus TaxID=259542 RepID=A0AAV4B3F1_9GAST|nr:hypothetical protein PoB_004061300 [Plakobranchus ocellatus]
MEEEEEEEEDDDDDDEEEEEEKKVRGFGYTVDSKSALRSAVTLLSQVRPPPPAPSPDGGPESLRCELAMYKKRIKPNASFGLHANVSNMSFELNSSHCDISRRFYLFTFHF